MYLYSHFFFFFFFNDTATTEIYTLSLHDALPIWGRSGFTVLVVSRLPETGRGGADACAPGSSGRDRKSTRLNSSHLVISYAVFCLKKKKESYLDLKTPHNTSCMPKMSISISTSPI